MSSKQNSTTISNVYKSRKIILEQCKERGYDISEWDNFSLNEVQSMYNNRELDMLLNHENGNKKMAIKYHLFTKLRPANVYEYVEGLYNVENILDKDDDFIIVVKNKPNDSLISMMKDLYNNEDIYLNVYDMHKYLFNILEHSFVPNHKVLSEEDKKAIYKKFNIVNDKELPEISRFDPVAQVIGLRPMELCEITRPSPTSITSKYYRLCK